MTGGKCQGGRAAAAGPIASERPTGPTGTIVPWVTVRSRGGYTPEPCADPGSGSGSDSGAADQADLDRTMKDAVSDDSDVVLSEDGRRLRPVKSLMRAIDLIRALADGGRPLGVTELAAATGSSKTAAYNLVTTLEIRGLVQRDAHNRYRLGWGLFELGEMVRLGSDLSEAARPQVAELAEQTGETALLAILDQDSVIYTEKSESRRSIRMAEAPGRRAPLDATAAGRILLAFAPAPYRRQYLAERRRARAQLSGGVDDLAARLDRIVIDGYDTSHQEREPDLTSVSVPIFGYGDEVIGALTVAGPVSRLTLERTREYLPMLRTAADTIGRAFGGRPHF